MKGHSKPLVFYFYRGTTGQVLMESHTDHPFQVHSSAGHALFHSPPLGFPSCLQPSPVDPKIITDTTKAVKSLSTLYPDLQNVYTSFVAERMVMSENVYGDEWEWLNSIASSHQQEPSSDVQVSSSVAPACQVVISPRLPTSQFYQGQLIAISPDSSQSQTFWLARIQHVRTSNLVVHWLEQQKKSLVFIQTLNEDTIPITSVLYSSIQLSAKNTITKKLYDIILLKKSTVD